MITRSARIVKRKWVGYSILLYEGQHQLHWEMFAFTRRGARYKADWWSYQSPR